LNLIKINVNKMKSKYVKQESPNWIKIKETNENLSLTERVKIAIGDNLMTEHFPFKEGFPKTPYDITNARFILIVPINDWKDVKEVEAIVNYSREWTEGLEWKTVNPRRNDYYNTSVIAWYEK